MATLYHTQAHSLHHQQQPLSGHIVHRLTPPILSRRNSTPISDNPTKPHNEWHRDTHDTHSGISDEDPREPLSALFASASPSLAALNSSRSFMSSLNQRRSSGLNGGHGNAETITPLFTAISPSFGSPHGLPTMPQHGSVGADHRRHHHAAATPRTQVFRCSPPHEAFYCYIITIYFIFIFSVIDEGIGTPVSQRRRVRLCVRIPATGRRVPRFGDHGP